VGELLSAAAVHLRREVVRFLRQRNRVVGALGTPLMFWFLIGSGLGKSFRAPTVEASAGLSYLQYFFPGTLLLTVLFTAIFSAISVIEDRREGFLQAVLVSPAPRGGLVLGKLLGGALLALLQAGLMMALAPLLGIRPTVGGAALAAAVLALVSFGLTGLGFLAAWRLDSVQGFHAVMNLVLMPLWFLSGALFPAAGAPAWLRAVMKVNPLSHAVDVLHASFYPALWTGGGNAVPALLLTGGFAALMFVLCAAAVGRRGT
jgi:ABC-2 type transport system permease protein